MNENTGTVSRGGIGITGLFSLAFVILKLCGVIKWSWWWVLAPTWIPTTFFVALMLFCLLMAVICNYGKSNR